MIFADFIKIYEAVSILLLERICEHGGSVVKLAVT